MYESVKRRKTYGVNLPLLAWLIPCLLVMAIVVGLLIWGWKYHTDYRDFLTDYSDSTHYAYIHNSMQAQINGQSHTVLRENIYTTYAAITSRGSGRVRKPPKEAPEAVLTFGDGSYMELWMVDIKNATNGVTRGLLVSYVNPEGKRYSYDSDRLKMQILPIEREDNIPQVKDFPAKNKKQAAC